MQNNNDYKKVLHYAALAAGFWGGVPLMAKNGMHRFK